MRVATNLLTSALLFSCAVPVSADEGRQPAKSDDIKLVPIKAAEVEKVVAAYKGKVVIVNVWSDFCFPCKKKFPYLVELHKELGKDGLVVLTLCVDEEEDEKAALDYVRTSKMTFPHFILRDTDAEKDKLEKVLSHKFLPLMHVFDRQGNKAKTIAMFKQEEFDKLIRDLLKQK